MEKIAINHLEELYKDEIDSHLKNAINNVDIESINSKDMKDKKQLLDKNHKYNQETNPKIKNSLFFRQKKDNININLYKPKEKNDNSFDNSNSEESQKKEIVYDSKIKKRNKITLKISKTFKNSGENINKAQLLLFNKGNNKQTLKPSIKLSTKNCLTSKRGNFFQSLKRHKKFRDKDKDKENEKESPYKNENINIFKRKKNHKSSNSNNKLLYCSKNNVFKTENNGEKNKNINENYDKDNLNNDYNLIRKRAKSNYIKNYLNSNSNKRRIISTWDKSKPDNNVTDKNKNNKIAPKIIYDTDNEVENKILSILDKSFKNRNSVVNIKKYKHYSTQELFNDKLVNNLNNSLDNNNNINNKISIEIGKISNFDSISIIKKTELNHLDINNELEDDFSKRNIEKKNSNYKKFSTQKIESFDYKDDENGENNYDNNFINSNNKTLKNKRKNKFIIYNNINYFKNTQREDNEFDDKRKRNNINSEDKDTKNDNKNSISNFTKCCYNSFFNCCFLNE